MKKRSSKKNTSSFVIPVALCLLSVAAGLAAYQMEVTADLTPRGTPIAPKSAAGRSSSEDKCGNKALDAGEKCDDGNAKGSDGCSKDCQKEKGWKCTFKQGKGSACVKEGK